MQEKQKGIKEFEELKSWWLTLEENVNEFVGRRKDVDATWHTFEELQIKYKAHYNNTQCVSWWRLLERRKDSDGQSYTREELRTKLKDKMLDQQFKGYWDSLPIFEGPPVSGLDGSIYAGGKPLGVAPVKPGAITTPVAAQPATLQKPAAARASVTATPAAVQPPAVAAPVAPVANPAAVPQAAAAAPMANPAAVPPAAAAAPAATAAP